MPFKYQTLLLTLALISLFSISAFAENKSEPSAEITNTLSKDESSEVVVKVNLAFPSPRFGAGDGIGGDIRIYLGALSLGFEFKRFWALEFGGGPYSTILFDGVFGTFFGRFGINPTIRDTRTSSKNRGVQFQFSGLLGYSFLFEDAQHEDGSGIRMSHRLSVASGPEVTFWASKNFGINLRLQLCINLLLGESLTDDLKEKNDSSSAIMLGPQFSVGFAF